MAARFSEGQKVKNPAVQALGFRFFRWVRASKAVYLFYATEAQTTNGLHVVGVADW